MASNGAPSKPWEINRSQVPPTGNNYGNLRSSSEVGETRTAPPVPTRPSQQRVSSPAYRPTYGNGLGYGTGYGSYGGYGLGGYGGMYGGSSLYGAGGMYGGSYRGYGTTNNGFTSQAEESTRQAFQSVESIVRAFTSVSTMLESTLGAVYSSFRAVLDVADHLSRVKTTFADILSSITIFRFIRFLYRRALSLFNLRQCDEAWDSSVTPGGDSPKPRSPRGKNSWPIMLFVAVVIGGPYLIWRLLRGSSSDEQKQRSSSWMSGDGDHVIARTEFDFQGAGDEELSFRAGDRVVLAPRDIQPNIRGWLLGTMDGKTPGYLPANHVKILGLMKGRNREQQNQQSSNPNGQSNVAAEEEWSAIHGKQAVAPADQQDGQSAVSR